MDYDTMKGGGDLGSQYSIIFGKYKACTMCDRLLIVRCFMIYLFYVAKL